MRESIILGCLFGAALLSPTPTSASESQNQNQTKCRALVLSGGSNNGAWEAGVIWGLLHYTDEPSNFAWDVISGVSAGAINTGGAAVWATGDEMAMTEWLSDQWATMTNDRVYQEWPEGVWAILKEQSALDSAPAVQTLTEIVGEVGEIKRRFVVSAVDANSGVYVPWTNENTDIDSLPQAVMSSASIPFVFPPQHMDGYVLMDGGSVWNINIPTAINTCLDQGYAQEDIILDVAICGYSSQEGGAVTNNALMNYRMAQDEAAYYHGGNAAASSRRAYPEVDQRFYFQERSPCPGSGGLDFNNSTTWCLQELGRQDAEDMLRIGQADIGQTLDEWYANLELKSEWPIFRDYLDYLFPRPSS